MPLNLDATSDDLRVWLQEAEEQLQLLDEDLIRLERESGDAELLQEIFRAAHTLKGSSAAIRHTRMAELTHSMESVLDDLRNGVMKVSSGLIDGLLEALDALRLLRDEVVTLEENAAIDVGAICERLAAVHAGAVPEPAGATADREPAPPAAVDFGLNAAETEHARALEVKGQTVYRVQAEIAAESAMPAARCLQVLADLRRLGLVLASQPTEDGIMAEEVDTTLQVLVATDEEVATLAEAARNVLEIESVDVAPYFDDAESDVRTADRSVLTPPEGDRRLIDLGPEARGKSEQDQLKLAAAKLTKLTQTVRIDVERLDNLMNLVGELVIDKTRLQQLAADFTTRFSGEPAVASLDQAALHVGRITDELQEEVMRSRMLPIDTVFNKLPRIVRDLARNMQKEVNFVVEGKETELDRSVIEEIGDPLIHIIRNSVDHGIEVPEQRLAAGKPREGTIVLSARHEENQIVISITDDGQGIDPERLRSKAVETGQLTEEAAARLSKQEAVELIFSSGLSTAEKVTDVSGRGVGMDIVRTNIEKVNGSVTVSSEIGRGSTVAIRLPLTLAIVRALLVRLGKQTYAIPLTSVMESLERYDQDIYTAQGNEVIRLRDDVLPLIRLALFFRAGLNGHAPSVGPAAAEANGQDDASPEGANGSVAIVAVRAGARRSALAVDALLGEQEVVIKSLGGFIGEATGIAGATILGDGRVAMIVDVNGVLQRNSEVA